MTVDTSEVSRFGKLLREAEKILITSHISPDPDAISSVLLLGRTLMENFPTKHVLMSLEEKPSRDLSFLAGYSQIVFKPVVETLGSFIPDLLAVVDANNYARISRNDSD